MGVVRSANERSLRVLHYLHHHSVLVLRSSSVFRAIEEGVRARPVSLVHALVSLAACSGCALSQGVAAPSLAATLVCVCRTRAGQVAVLSILLAIGLQVLRVMQYAVFGRLRVIEWQVRALSSQHARRVRSCRLLVRELPRCSLVPRAQRFWERLVNFLMGQLIVLGAVVEPDLAEMVLWGSFTALVCLLGMYAGLARDRIEYMAHTPTPPSRAAWVRVVGLEVCLILIVLGAVVGGVALMHEASASMLTLFFFPAALLGAETSHALVLAFLQQRERHEGSSDLMYYASLLPELSLQLCRLLHQLHLWYAHGVSFSVIDVLLFANAKLAFEGLHRRVVTHRNFLRADANLQKLFRSASPEELANLDDCCAICREPMADAAKVLPCGHYFHCTCLRSWLEQSHSCPVCRASLTDDPNGPPSTTGRAQHGLGAGAGVRTGVAGAVPAGATATAERAPPGMAPRPARRRRLGPVVEQSSRITNDRHRAAPSSAAAPSAPAGSSSGAGSSGAGSSGAGIDAAGAAAIAAVERLIVSNAAATAAERRAAPALTTVQSGLSGELTLDLGIEQLMAEVPGVAQAATAAMSDDRVAGALVLELAHARAAARAAGRNVADALANVMAATDAASAAAFPGVRPMRTATARALGSASASASVSAAAGAASAAAGALSQNGWEARGEEGEGEEDEGEEEGEGEVEEDDGYEAGSIHATDDCRSSLIATDCLPHQVRR